MHAVKCNNKLENIWIQKDRLLLLLLESEIEYFRIGGNVGNGMAKIERIQNEKK